MAFNVVAQIEAKVGEMIGRFSVNHDASIEIVEQMLLAILQHCGKIKEANAKSQEAIDAQSKVQELPTIEESKVDECPQPAD